MFIAALSIIARSWKEPRCPSMEACTFLQSDSHLPYSHWRPTIWGLGIWKLSSSLCVHAPHTFVTAMVYFPKIVNMAPTMLVHASHALSGLQSVILNMTHSLHLKAPVVFQCRFHAHTYIQNTFMNACIHTATHAEYLLNASCINTCMHA